MMSRPERLARFLALGLLGVITLGIGFAVWNLQARPIEVHARMPEDGGWLPGDLTAIAGVPLHLRLTSDDVVHGFAIGQSDQPALDVQPGVFTEATLLFDYPGKYTYYCTRWCGPNHWRMRGTIEVTGGTPLPTDQTSPLYIQLGLDIDAEHHAHIVPSQKPSAIRGAALGVEIPRHILSADYYRSHSPQDTWEELRQISKLPDSQVWDAIAYVWQSNAPSGTLQLGRELYAANCAACHGETGQGDGVYAAELGEASVAGHTEMPAGEMTQSPTVFTEAEHMLAASPAHLQGKIIRGGMGTGMPYWGPIFTEEQTWALVAYLWTFQFEMEATP
jgi:mono/diheme cytochrome c family protein